MWRDLSERRAFRKKRARVTFLAFIVWKKRNSGSTACYSRKTRAAVRRAGQGEALLLRLHQKEAFWSLIKELSGFKSHSFGSIVVWCLAPSKLEEIMKSHIVWNPIISHQHILDCFLNDWLVFQMNWYKISLFVYNNTLSLKIICNHTYFEFLISDFECSFFFLL